ncbi:hypothetical protein FE784_36220 [Paenibacillus hemerocallicola]|uniref:Uncharacterized protein n=1 Tax=Paenibacillus hemerocallicola TaxID=1172614 RepID=A0A5C4SXG8_9BACL|nr:hypothetical protein [Paenibacillus hemerocallicola]TNJ60314.1 hypothetical protein FE784_36220 [Paenibacillus hemerocallicola]
MNDSSHNDYDTIRAVLRRLPEDRDGEREELLRLVDGLERREAAERENAERLQAENDRLKLDMRKLRTAQAGVMSSRLRDALRE